MARATKIKARPSLSPENEEAEMIALAMGLAKQQMLDGTASSQVITHYLKLGTSRAKLEAEKLKHETEVLKAKRKAYESGEEIKELYENALKAMRSYQGYGDPDEYDEY